MIVLATMTPGWQVKFTGWSWWLVCLLAVAGTYALLRLHRLELRSMPARVRQRLLWLRGSALSLLILFLMEPVVTRKTTERVLPQVAVVVDQSGSMAVKDEFMSPGAKLAEAIGLGLLPAGIRPLQTEPADQAASDRALLADAKQGSPVSEALATLLPFSRYDRAVRLVREKIVPSLDDKARVKVFGLDAALAPLNLNQPAKLRPKLATDFESSLATLARQWAQEYVGGVLLISDGRQTAGANPLPVIRSLRARGALVYGVMVGDPASPPDAVIAEISGSSEVFLGENVPLSVRYRITGAAEADWDLVVSREGREIGRRKVRGNGQWQYENFAFAATNAGINLYQAQLGLAREQSPQSRARKWKEASLANNSAETSVVVNEDPIKVLLVDSTPRWESRYLASMFERDRRVSFSRRYHSVTIQEPGLWLLPRTQAEWDSYDMVCLGDLDANELPPEQQVYLANFVARRGGFLVCLAGPRGLPGAFSLGTLASVLPVRVAFPSGRANEPVTVRLTAAGADHSMMQILSDPSHNQKLWPLLPPLQWVADSVVAKPGATVLLAAQDAAGTPIVAVQRYGAGRVFWMGTEESWRWRDRLGERVHQTFWLQAMRWGLAGRLRGKDTRLQVGLDRYLMGPEESAELKARLVTATGDSIQQPPVVKLDKIGDHGEAVADSSEGTRARSMLPMPDVPGIWRLPVEALEEGLWRLTVTHSVGAAEDLTETRDLVVRGETGAEGLELSGDLMALERMASAGGGQATTMDQTDALMKEFVVKLKPRLQERRETIRLWNSYLSMIVVMVLLCTEWVLRKRQGLP